jgi:hypothetical protein
MSLGSIDAACPSCTGAAVDAFTDGDGRHRIVTLRVSVGSR